MWLLQIKGVNKDEFHNVCFMSAECKASLNDKTHLKAQYHLKKDALSDVRDLIKAFPSITYELTNLGKTNGSLWFY